MKYPFSPAMLDAMPEEVAEIFRSLELTLLDEICSRLNLADALNEVTLQDIRVLRSHGINLSEIKEAIKKSTAIGEEKLNAVIDDAVERNKAYYGETATLADVTIPQMLLSDADIDTIRRQTNNEYTNITQSMGFLVDSGRTMLPPAKAYQWAIDNAAIQIQSGGISYNEAVKNAVKQLADSGIKTVDYESGHVDHVDVAVRRAVMTAVNQLNRRYEEQAMEYLKTDLVEVSAHQGARDIDGPMGWENHKAWQGKVYRWKQYPKSSEKEYPDFEETCGYGDVTGILGANCRHSFAPFIEGVSERTYTDEQLAKIDPPPFEYEGRTYTAYEATQMQRRVERTIRKLQREETAYTASGNKTDAQLVHIRKNRLSAKYHDFSAKAGLPEQPERMKVYSTQGKTIATASPIFVNKNDQLFKNAKNIKPIDGYEDIVTHADKYGFVFSDADGKESNVSAYEFAEILKSSGLYHGGKIRLIACEAAADGAVSAQGLANALGVDVLAPSDVVYVRENGEVFVSSNGLTENGEWRKIVPKK